MLTCAEVGHSNVFLATAHSLLTLCPSLTLHIASQERLRKTFTDAFANIKPPTNDENYVPPTFHLIEGPTVEDSLERFEDPKNRFTYLNMLKPGFRNTPLLNKHFINGLFISWTAEQWVDMFNRSLELIRSIEPDIVVMDGLFGPGTTAARLLRENEGASFKLVILSPNSLKDFTSHREGGVSFFTKWPAMASAIPMPIPWYLIPLNFYYVLRIMVAFTLDKDQPKRLAEIRKLTGLPELEVDNLLTATYKGAPGTDRILLGSSPEVEFPCLVHTAGPKEFRERLVCCGPILRSAIPLVEADPELSEWLKGGPVIYINLGSIVRSSADEALVMAKALRKVLDKATHKGTRVLWKLKRDEKRGPVYSTGPGSAVHGVLAKEMAEDRARIVDWVMAEPASLLMTGNITCTVTHGGASSYYEATV